MTCTLVAEGELNVEINHFDPSLLKHIMANIIYNTDRESDILQVLHVSVCLPLNLHNPETICWPLTRSGLSSYRNLTELGVGEAFAHL